MSNFYAPPSLYELDGINSGPVAGSTINDMFIFWDTQIQNENLSEFYNLLLTTPGPGPGPGPGPDPGVPEVCVPRWLVVDPHDRGMHIKTDDRTMVLACDSS